MKECFVEGNTLPEAYHKALEALYNFGEETECDYQTLTSSQKELTMTFHVEHPLAEPMISKLLVSTPYDFERYRQEMIEGRLDCMIGKGWDYTYHDRIVNYPTEDKNKTINQIDFVINELKRNPNTRRAVIITRSYKDMDVNTTDPACLQTIQYFIRNNKLDCQVIFRSNDAVEASFMNAWGLILLQKKIADNLGIEVGTYSHRANSYHCYQKDYELLEGYVNRIKSGKNLTFDYIDEFKDLMDEAKPKVETTFNQITRKIEN